MYFANNYKFIFIFCNKKIRCAPKRDEIEFKLLNFASILFHLDGKCLRYAAHKNI